MLVDKTLNVAHFLKVLFTPALNIHLKWLEMEVRSVTQMNYFSNIYRILMNIINL